MEALILNAEQKTAQVNTIPKPIPQQNEILILVHSIALNPVDSLYVYNPLGSSGRVIGSDFAGVVESLGPSVSATGILKPGDRVAGFLQGASSVNDRPGAFAEYLVSPWDLVWKVPDGLSLEDAAAVSLCGLTAAQALFYRLGLKAPFEWDEQRAQGSPQETQESETSISVFIYGASTSVGLYAAQLVRRAAEAGGGKVRLIGSASRKHFELLKAEPYSYDYLVDYRDNDWSEQVRSFTGGEGVNYAYDCISEGLTIANTAKCLAAGGRMAVVRSRQGGAWDTPKEELPVEPIYGAVWEGLGENVQYVGMFLSASKQARSFAVAFYKWLSESGKLQANPIRLMPGGLKRIKDDGLKLLGSGNMEDRDVSRTEEWMKPVSAEKLVYILNSSS
jgi:NADPH:quinone reductase-like Zn-dependent oxidoreductase